MCVTGPFDERILYLNISKSILVIGLLKLEKNDSNFIFLGEKQEDLKQTL